MAWEASTAGPEVNAVNSCGAPASPQCASYGSGMFLSCIIHVGENPPKESISPALSHKQNSENSFLLLSGMRWLPNRNLMYNCIAGVCFPEAPTWQSSYRAVVNNKGSFWRKQSFSPKICRWFFLLLVSLPFLLEARCIATDSTDQGAEWTKCRLRWAVLFSRPRQQSVMDSGVICLLPMSHRSRVTLGKLINLFELQFFILT